MTDEVVQAQLALETAVARTERIRRQRDEAREQRDEARVQRDEAREQRDNLTRMLEASAAAVSESPVAPSKNTRSGRTRRPRRSNLIPVGFKALPQSDLPSRAYSLGKFDEREKVRLRIEKRLSPRQETGQPLSLLERELRASRKVPPMRRYSTAVSEPGTDVAFVTVANIGFYPGLLGLVLSLTDVYPGMESKIFVYHDGSIGQFAQDRLTDIYSNIEFINPDMGWLDLSGVDFADAKRIGRLGYMKFLAMTLSGFRRVVILDSDMLIIDDISSLWIGGNDDARVSYDLGNREFAVMSDHTKTWIINSGVISLPGQWCTPEEFAQVGKLISRTLAPLNDLLDQFADQKSWNVFLSQRPTTYLEVNFNCNVKYAGRFLGGKLEAISVLHFAGPKPWNSADYLPADLLGKSKSKSMACVFPNMWIDRYRALLFKNRSLSFCRDQQARARTQVPAGRVERAARCVITDDYSQVGAVQIRALRSADVIHVIRDDLPSFFEELAPKHVVFASHEVLGGWNSFNPQIPPECARRLSQMTSRPVIWAPYYFKPIFEAFRRKHGFEVRYLLHEAPFVRQAGDLGVAECGVEGFIDDLGSDTVTFGVPIAHSLGYRKIAILRDPDDLLTGAGNDAEASAGDADHAASALALVTRTMRDRGAELSVSEIAPRPVSDAVDTPDLAQAWGT